MHCLTVIRANLSLRQQCKFKRASRLKQGIAIDAIILLLKLILPVRTIGNTYTSVRRISMCHIKIEPKLTNSKHSYFWPKSFVSKLMIMPEFFFASLFAGHPQACIMRSFAATNIKPTTGNFLRQHRIFFDRDTNLLYGTENSKTSPGSFSFWFQRKRDLSSSWALAFSLLRLF